MADRATLATVAAGIMAALCPPSVAQAEDPAVALGKAYAAYDAGNLEEARAALDGVNPAALVNRDYYYWLDGQVALLRGDAKQARAAFTELGKIRDSRFGATVPWRLADCAWQLGQRAEASKAYKRLLTTPGASERGDLGTATYRIAISEKNRATGAAALRAFVLDYPAHPLAKAATSQLAAMGKPVVFSPEDRILRAQKLIDVHHWHEAVAELELIGEGIRPALAVRRNYWLGTALFKMRRRYGDAGRLLLAAAPSMGGNAAEAMFHGARALSRADRDDDAIVWYRKVVETYPSTSWAAEAQYLSGWLEFNRGNFDAAVAPLETLLRKYPRSEWADDGLWFLGMSHYLGGRFDAALARFDELSKRSGALAGGKGAYWRARTLERRGAKDESRALYRTIVKRWPFSWYALLGRARLKEAGQSMGPFGDDPTPVKIRPLATAPDPALAGDPLLRSAAELVRAGLGAEAGEELRRGERGFLSRTDRTKGLATLLDAYQRAGNFNRPWMLAVVQGGEALDGPPTGDARGWWLNAYPRAYRELVEKWQDLGKNPDGYLYSIMRKESGFDPHVLSYADAQGLLQMIPATTERVAAALGISYGPGDLYEPDLNIRTGSWYIGRLLTKFKGQIPIGAGAFNSGPRPVMRWLDQNGDRPIDEFVELVSYQQTREYMKKVTENYARYRYLYKDEIYELPLVVDKKYLKDELTY